MDNTTVIIIVAALIVVAAIAFAGWMHLKKKRTMRLRSRFGPEYDRLAEIEGGRARAEKTLHEREKRVERLNLVPLSPKDRDRFAGAWQQEQARFVDDPRAAVANADSLVTEVMKVRGYPMGDFEQRAADISVDHSLVVKNYHIAHAIALRDSGDETSTEELRTALLHYRMLFEDLLTRYAAEPENQKVTAVGALGKQ
jgi:FtsZ-interacting cell division protein ZipA